ncbi:hypothetical protein SCARD494_12332 [Seiridium cardinale]
MTQKRARPGARGVRKLRTGCQTCKTRRKKCDEVRPSCSQCLGAGWQCDFSKDPGTADTVAAHIIDPSPTALLGLSPWAVPNAHLVALDSQLLSYYRLVTGNEFALFFDDPAWEGRVLQVAHTEPTIHHASLAISALSLDNNSAGRFWGSRQACSAVEYSTKQYNLAIQRLNDCMERSIPQATEIMILGILMFIHLEFMRGYRDVVSVHLQGAFALLRKLKTSQFDTDYFQTALVYIEAQQQELWRFDGLRPG